MRIRERFTDFPWVPSLLVSLTAGGVYFLIENPSVLPNSFRDLAVSTTQYGLITISLLALFGAGLSLILQWRQKVRWRSIRKDLQNKDVSANGNGAGVVRSPEQLLSEQIDRVNDLLWITEDGDINITDNNLGEVQKMLLYLIGVRYAYELYLVDSPQISGPNLSSELNIPYQSIIGWQFALNEVMEKNTTIWRR